MSKWISVEDRIPPDQQEVLVYTVSQKGIGNIDKGYWSIDHFIHRGRARVTHWMPLPEPPGKRRVATETCLFCGQEITGNEGENG